ncbi:hypothetical protein HDV01_002362 [Terramyces sp. JEL0728]|nr:hypothetical protein HDV01_002362 [Terramyces sp. JEL0728]
MYIEHLPFDLLESKIIHYLDASSLYQLAVTNKRLSKRLTPIRMLIKKLKYVWPDLIITCAVTYEMHLIVPYKWKFRNIYVLSPNYVDVLNLPHRQKLTVFSLELDFISADCLDIGHDKRKEGAIINGIHQDTILERISGRKEKELRIKGFKIGQHIAYQLESLTHLSMVNCQLDDIAVAQISQRLKNIKYIDLSGNCIEGMGLQSLLQLNLTKLDVSLNPISNAAFKSFIRQLPQSDLKELGIIGIHQTDFYLLFDLLESTKLEKIDFDPYITNRCEDSLLASFKSSKLKQLKVRIRNTKQLLLNTPASLEALQLTHKLGKEDVHALKHCCRLKSLKLYYHDERLCSKLARALTKFFADGLTTLDFSGSLNVEALIPLISPSINKSVLSVLKLNNCNMSNSIIDLALCVPGSKLKYLELRDNKINKVGLVSLLNILLISNVEYLDIKGNEVLDQEGNLIKAFKRKNKCKIINF